MQTKHDTIQRFLLEEAHVRGEMAYLHQAYQTIIEQRVYPPIVQQLLGETLVACLLIADTIKFEGSLSIQFEGDERLSLLLVQCDHQHQLRGLAKFTPDLTDEDYSKAFLQGQMVITLQSKINTQNYQSKLPIQSLSIADNLMHYFAQSEQIPSFVWICADAKQAGGLLLQLLPAQQDTPAHSEERENFWEYASKIGQTITQDEFFTLDNETLLYRLYHETRVRLFEPNPVKFQCRCTPERMHQVLRVLGEEECKQLINTHKIVEARCDFCNHTYPFDAVDVALIFKKSS
ncbi:MAG: Hsp33 family molecular chaperone HslO [Gammaproteobacteria bacterium]|nr:Hsp33 family molecular chaperone HslO [Gammaproteobacteria bacterium]